MPSSIFTAPRIPTATITPWSMESLGSNIANSNTVITGTWSSANLAVFIPFRIYTPVTAYSMFICNANRVTGSFDVGIYSFEGITITRIVSSGPTAQAGINSYQKATITQKSLGIGQYYMAMSMNSASASVIRKAPGTTLSRISGMLNLASAYPLPATATPTIATNFLPLFGIRFVDV